MSLAPEIMPDLAPEKVQLLLTQAENRNKSIPRMLKRKNPFMRFWEAAMEDVWYLPNLAEKDSNFPQRRTRGAVSLGRAAPGWYLPHIYVEGQENLDQARKILQVKGKVIGISTHKTDGDTLGIQEALIRSGNLDLAGITGFPAGLKMWERFYIRPFVECISAFPVVTPADEENIQNLLINQDKYGLGKKEVESMVKYKELGQNLMRRSGIAMRRFTMKGNLLIVYIEATRSRTDSFLQPAREEVMRYFDMDDLWILPIEVHGIEKINPPEEAFHWKEKTDAFVTFGKPFLASRLREIELPETLLERSVRRADLLTLEQARLNRSMVDPKDMEYYDALDEYVASQALAS